MISIHFSFLFFFSLNKKDNYNSADTTKNYKSYIVDMYFNNYLSYEYFVFTLNICSNMGDLDHLDLE